MVNKIEEGDNVRHITPAINGGLQLTVLEIDEDELNAKCSHFVSDNGDVVHKETWFPIRFDFDKKSIWRIYSMS